MQLRPFGLRNSFMMTALDNYQNSLSLLIATSLLAAAECIYRKSSKAPDRFSITQTSQLEWQQRASSSLTINTIPGCVNVLIPPIYPKFSVASEVVHLNR